MKLTQGNKECTHSRLAIGIFALFALTIWYCKCHGQNRQRQQEASERRQMLIRQLSRGRAAISVPAPERPSRYRSNAPPAYDDVINKPQDYPIYHADAQGESRPVFPIFNLIFLPMLHNKP